MSETKIIGVDIGYGFLKVFSEDKTVVIPSVIGNSVELTFEFRKGSDLKHIEVEYDGTKYFVGEMAILQSTHPYRSLSVDRTNDIVTAVMLLTGLALVSEEKEASFTVVTGLPVKDFTLFKQTYINTFSGKHTITVNGEKKTLHIKKVVVVPQPYGTFCDGLLKEDGEVDSNFAKNHVGIIDIGYKTSDIIQFDDLNYLERFSSTSANGISSIYKDVSNYLSTKHSIYKEDYQLEECVQDGYLKIRNGRIDLSEVIGEAKRSLAKKISTEVKSLWGNLPEVEVVIVTGGGGSLLHLELMELLGDDVVLSPEPQIANVRGYWRWGVYLSEAEDVS